MAVAPTQDVKVWKNYIGGEWVEASSGDTFEVINPSNGEVVAAVPKGGREDAQAAIAAAKEQAASGGRVIELIHYTVITTRKPTPQTITVIEQIRKTLNKNRPPEIEITWVHPPTP